MDYCLDKEPTADGLLSFVIGFTTGFLDASIGLKFNSFSVELCGFLTNGLPSTYFGSVVGLAATGLATCFGLSTFFSSDGPPAINSISSFPFSILSLN
jgi:hypothetical protein